MLQFGMENKQPQHNLTKLAQIQELSEENQTRYFGRKTPLVVQTPSKVSNQGFTVLKGSLLCLKNMLGYCLKKPKKREYDINEEQMTKQVQKIKKKKGQMQVLLPPLAHPKLKTLVLDMDETLISASFKKTKVYDFSTNVQIHGQREKVYVTKRFGLDIFLFEMSQLYELVVFTAGIRDYTTRVLQTIDPQKRIKHILTREHCTILNSSYFLKNLALLGRELKYTILVDDNSMAGVLQPENFYKIEPFYGDSHDRKLLRLIQFLKLMAGEQDLRCLVERRKEFESRQKRPSSVLRKQAKIGLEWEIKEETQTSSHSFAKESSSSVSCQ